MDTVQIFFPSFWTFIFPMSSTTYSSQGLIEIQGNGPTKLWNFKQDSSVNVGKDGTSLVGNSYYFSTVKGNVKVTQWSSFLIYNRFVREDGTMRSKSLIVVLMATTWDLGGQQRVCTPFDPWPLFISQFMHLRQPTTVVEVTLTLGVGMALDFTTMRRTTLQWRTLAVHGPMVPTDI